MRLDELLKSVELTRECPVSEIDVTGVAYDSRQVKPGFVFVAIAGYACDGTEFIADALSRGAVAVFLEEDFDLGTGVLHFQVPNARRTLAQLSNAFYGELSREMTVVGITGTNGKTTTSYMVREMLKGAGHRSGLLGTVAYEIGDHVIPASRTTPESTDIHSFFSRMKSAGCDSVVMEVSSHALSLERVHGIEFDVGIFTNLTQDHLDFHQDMDQYFKTKSRLFEEQPGKTSVINIDDSWGSKLAKRLESGPAQLMTYGFNEDAVVRASKVKMRMSGSRFRVSTPWGEATVKLKLLGRFNISNALAALAAGGALGIDLKTMVQVLGAMKCVSGRLEAVPNRRGRQIFVDYAHTDDALRNVIGTLREIGKGRLIVVFGCGGNRDSGKREKMGNAVSELADVAVITSDNPRNEEPQKIVDDIIVGFTGSAEYTVELDRRKAIQQAIKQMKRHDILLVAGKGHETYQEIQGTVVPFDDRETVLELMG